MSEPTPTPWHVGPYYKSDVQSREGRVAECGVTRGPRAEANAALIVRAVNAFEPMRIALAHLWEFYGDEEKTRAPEWAERSQAALKLAEESR